MIRRVLYLIREEYTQQQDEQPMPSSSNVRRALADADTCGH